MTGHTPDETGGRPGEQKAATVLRDWLHTTELSRCNMGSDTCLDWQLAHDLAAKVYGPIAAAVRADLAARFRIAAAHYPQQTSDDVELIAARLLGRRCD